MSVNLAHVINFCLWNKNNLNELEKKVVFRSDSGTYFSGFRFLKNQILISANIYNVKWN